MCCILPALACLSVRWPFCSCHPVGWERRVSEISFFGAWSSVISAVGGLSHGDWDDNGGHGVGRHI